MTATGLPSEKKSRTKARARSSVRRWSGLATPPGSTRPAKSAASASSSVRSTSNCSDGSRWSKDRIVSPWGATSTGVPPAPVTALQGSVSSTLSTPSVARKAMRRPVISSLMVLPLVVCPDRSGTPALPVETGVASPFHRPPGRGMPSAMEREAHPGGRPGRRRRRDRRRDAARRPPGRGRGRVDRARVRSAPRRPPRRRPRPGDAARGGRRAPRRRSSGAGRRRARASSPAATPPTGAGPTRSSTSSAPTCSSPARAVEERVRDELAGGVRHRHEARRKRDTPGATSTAVHLPAE